MDPDSPITRVERTLWTVWCYITEAVNRFFRPPPGDTIRNDPNTVQETSVDSEPPESSSTRADSSGREGDEERPLATVSLLSSSSPAVAWEACTTEVDLRSDEESTQLSGENNSEETGESTREEQLGQTGSDDAGVLVAEENEDEHKKTDTEQGEQGERPDAGSSSHTDRAMSEDVEEAAAGEKAMSAITLDDHQIMGETTTGIQVTKNDGNEGEEELQVGHHEVKLCKIKDLGSEEEDFKEKAVDHLDGHQSIDVQTTKEDGNKDDKELEEDCKVKLCTVTELGPEEERMLKEKADDHLDDYQVMGETTTQIQVTKDDGNKGREELEEKGDEVEEGEDCMFKEKAVDHLDGHQKVDETIAEVQLAKDERNKDGEEVEEDPEVKLCKVTDLSPEEDIMLNRNAAQPLNDHQKIDETMTEVQVNREPESEDKEELDDVEDHEVKLSTITDSFPEEEARALKEKAADLLDDHPKMDETTTEVQVAKDEGTENEEELEEDTEVKLTMGDLSPEQDNMLKENTTDLMDHHQRMDETTAEVQITKDDGNKDDKELEEECNVKLCKVTELSPEEEVIMFKEKADDHLDVYQRMDETTTEVQVAKQEKEDEGELGVEDAEIKRSKSSEEDLDDHQRIDETTTEVQVAKDEGTKDGEELEEDPEVKLDTILDLSPEEESVLKEKAVDHTDDLQRRDEPEVQAPKQEKEDEGEVGVEDPEIKHRKSSEEDSMFKGKPEVQSDDAVTMVTWDEVQNYEGALNLPSEGQNMSDEGTKQAEHHSVCEEVPDLLKDEQIVFGQEVRGENDQTEDVTIQVVNKEEEDVIETTDEESEMENRGGIIMERGQEENNLTQYVTCSQETVVDTDVQTTSETEVSLGERFVDKDQVEEERLSSEIDNKDSCMEKVCTAPSLTVKPRGETEQEISGEFKNIPLQTLEGQVVVSQELNTQVCEERQAGVPELNNELEPDENTTQRFLEGGNCEEIQITQLPEEVETKEQENLKNSGTGAGYLLVKEGLEARLHSEEDPTNTSDFVAERSGKLHLAQEPEELCVNAVHLESEYSAEKDEEESLQSPMKTEIKHFDKELETYIDSADEADKTAEKLQNEAEEAGSGVTGTLQTEQDLNKSPIFAEEITECGLLKQSVETVFNLSDDSTVETQNTDTDKEDYADEEEEDKIRLQGVSTENGEAELSLHFQAQDAKKQAPNRALQTNELEIKVENEAVDESKPDKPNDLLESSEHKAAGHVTQSEEAFSEEAISSVRGHQEVIDEEILDLWIETAMSEDTCETEPEGSDPDLLRDTTSQPGNEELGEISSQMGEDQLRESNSMELVFVRDTETSSSAVDSAVLDQLFSEGSLQGIQDLSGTASESVTVPELSAPKSVSQNILLEETAETEHNYVKDEQPVTETGFCLDSGVSPPETKCLNQESDESQEKQVEESAETEAEMLVLGRENEEADVTSQLKTNTEAEEETLEVSTSDLSDEFKDTESGRWGVDSEASSEEVTMSREPGSEDQQPQDESGKNIPSLDEDIPDSTLGLNRAEVAQEHASKSEDQSEVDAPVLDFSVQRSRIAVKNPRVRPPTNPRSLLNMPSADPTPTSHVPVKVPAGVPLGGLGIGIKLPGLGAGLPVLKKTQRVARDEDSQETHPQEPEKKAEEKSEAPKQDEAQQRPKWMPPGRPGFGNPLMSELKSKLRKTT